MQLDYPATSRNRDPILAVLREILPTSGLVLEVASGSGQHCLHFAGQLPGLEWQPTDPDGRARASIEAYRRVAGLANLRAPLALDATSPAWPVAAADAVLAINMVHISPWEATLGLLDGAARLLLPGAPLYLYGPYMVKGSPTTDSNARFHESLRSRDPAWGLRDLEVMQDEAARRGLAFVESRDMPAHNFSLIFRRE